MTGQTDVKTASRTGTISYSNECVYNGEYVESGGQKLKHGTGRITMVTQFYSQRFEEWYEGEWKNDKKEGHGKYSYINGAVYEGEWKDGFHDGQGIYLFPDGSYYEGGWKAHKMHGKGTYVDTRGKVWSGEFREGLFDSRRQAELKRQAQREAFEADFKGKIDAFFGTVLSTLEKDKKGLKELLKRSLASDLLPETATLFTEKLSKYEDKKADIW